MKCNYDILPLQMFERKLLYLANLLQQFPIQSHPIYELN